MAKSPRNRAAATDYLLPREIAALERIGVSKTALQFAKKLTEAELRTAWQAVFALRSRSPKSDDWTNWLVGDWMNETDTRLGPGTAEKIIPEEDLEYHYTQHLWRLSGATLHALQLAEFTMGICCRLFDPKRAGEMTVNMFSPNAATRKRTLAQLNRLLKEHRIFVDEFEARLNRFVSDRNRFAHQLWVESSPGNRSDHAAHIEMLKTRESFILNLLAEAYAIGAILRGLSASIGVALAERDNVATVDCWLGELQYDFRQFGEVQRKP
ncbi:MAG: hypothetical protein ACXWZE_12320 [Candidatus Binatia bacterium]